jgi:hypothetical protein
MIIISKILEVIAENGIRFFKLLRFGENDSVKAFGVNPFGIDSKPPDSYKALYLRTSNSNESVCIGFINKVILNDLNSGENQIFSTDETGENISAFIKLLNDGTMQIMGDSDFAVGFNELKTGFDQLVSDVNAIKDVVNNIRSDQSTFASAYIPGGPAVQGTPPIYLITSTPASASSADIDSSKKENIKTE